MEEKEIAIEDNLGDDSDEIIPFQYSITSYGADYPVDGLVKRIADDSIYVPSFQRGFVWNISQASRFVESLLLGLPVPGIFLSREQGTQRLLVIDGQQRLRTLQYFYEGVFPPTKKQFALSHVQSQFKGATYKSLSDEDRRLLDDSILHATIVKQDEPSEDDSSVYHIFERLNTGGNLLQPQEIRACIYHGEFNDVLRRLNKDKCWRSVYGPVSSRMRDQELILRFLALYFNGSVYKKPMKGFLNRYMGKNRGLAFHPESQLAETFTRTIDLVHQSLGMRAFKPKRALNAAVFDAVMVGIARRAAGGGISDISGLAQRYARLLKNKEFVGATEKGTADEESVRRRMTLATAAFSDLP